MMYMNGVRDDTLGGLFTSNNPIAEKNHCVVATDGPVCRIVLRAMESRKYADCRKREGSYDDRFVLGDLHSIIKYSIL